MTTIVTIEDSIERPDESWKYPYVAAVIDFGTNFNMQVGKADSRAVGYSITPTLIVQNTDPAVIGFLDEFCANHGLNPRSRERDERYRLEVSRRDDVHRLLQLVQPYIIARDEPVRILLKHLLPGLDLGKHSDEQGFIELMGYVDEIRKHTIQRREPKYDQDYFREEFGQ